MHRAWFAAALACGAAGFAFVPEPLMGSTTPEYLVVTIQGDDFTNVTLTPLPKLPQQLSEEFQTVCSGTPLCGPTDRRDPTAFTTLRTSPQPSCCVPCAAVATFLTTFDASRSAVPAQHTGGQECRRKRRLVDATLAYSPCPSAPASPAEANSDPTFLLATRAAQMFALGDTQDAAAAKLPTVLCSNNFTEIEQWVAEHTNETGLPIQVYSEPSETALIDQAALLGQVAAVSHLEARDGTYYAHLPQGARLFNATNELDEELMILCHEGGGGGRGGGDPTRRFDYMSAFMGMIPPIMMLLSAGPSRVGPATSECHALRVGSYVWLAAASAE